MKVNYALVVAGESGFIKQGCGGDLGYGTNEIRELAPYGDIGEVSG